MDNFFGQEKLVGKKGILRILLETGHLPSMLFWGPPGVGKTTLAEILARSLGLPFYILSAVSAGVKEVKEITVHAKQYGRVVLFLDEIHRFNKSQQDALLNAVERGHIILIGATTENPSFEINFALLSRAQVFVFEPLSAVVIQSILDYALTNDTILKDLQLELKDEGILAQLAMGDARRALGFLEMVIAQLPPQETVITPKNITSALGDQVARYDKSGDMHYDCISAFIKSLRGSDPNAALYWMARMLQGGEDPKFIARRMLILASEDIGNANPTALVLANACFQTVSVVGMPEARIVLGQACTYLACSPKSNSAYKAIDAAMAVVRTTGDLPVPLHLRNAPTRMMKEMGFGREYAYAHDFPGNFVHQTYLPEQIDGNVFYKPGENPREKEMRQFLASRWKDKYDYGQ